MITGIGVHDQTEPVFTIDWNLCSRSNGIGVHDSPESALYQRGETIEATPHVRQAGGEPDPHAGTGGDHPRNAVSTRRSVVRLTPSSTRTRLPSFSSISMWPGLRLSEFPALGCGTARS